MDHKILVVDDVWENIYIVERILKKEGYYVKTANSAALALDMVHKEKFDLILLDLQMPEMDGFTVCKILKADSRFSGIPVIFLTATNEPQSISKGFKIGGSDYLTKPFNPSELIARIHNHLELKEKREGQKREIRLARQIQEKLLPINLEEIKGLQFSVKYLPYGELSGDIYDIAEIFPGYIRIFLADATGHGISAALVTMLIKSEYETIKSSFASPAKTLMELNTRFIQNYINLNEIFPAFILDIDLNTMKACYASAGHSAQIALLNCFEGFLEHTGKIIGVYKNNIYQEREFELQIGDKFLLFTDGLYEQFNPDKMEYGLITLLQLIQEKRRLRTSELLEVIFKDIQEFIGPDNKIQEHDDITVISLEITKDKLRGTV